MGEFLEPNGELLPLTSKVGRYYVYNVTTVADVMDLERAKIRWFDKKHDVADEVKHFAFYELKLKGLSIFRLVELPASTFVTNTFAEAVTKHSLNGFNFVKVWPFPEGVSWEREKLKKQRAPTVVPTESGEQPIKGNTVVIVLSLAKHKPSAGEKRRISELLDELDGLLVERQINAPYFGSLEGKEYVDGKARIFLTCPDADALVERLRSWLTSLWWSRRVTVTKRYGEYVDPNAAEEVVEL